MPAAYAHYRFGKKLLPSLPGDVRQCIQRFRRMYDAGLQGPDLFFYYNPFLKTAIGDLGHSFHMQSGQEFFTAACAAANSEAARAYLYGLLGHYCLDSVCHPLIRRLADIGEAGHVALESEFDRFLMERDKIPSPHTHDLKKHLHLTRGECMTVSGFYPPANGAHVSRSIKTMAFFNKFFASPNRALVEKLVGRFSPQHLDYLIPESEAEALAPYIQELSTLLEEALARYPQLLQQLTAHMQTGEALGDDFAAHFG